MLGIKSYNERYIKSQEKDVKKVTSYEPIMQELSDSELRDKTDEFKDRLANGETLDDVMHEAFAVVREASKRTLGMRHYDCQVVGGFALNEGKVVEMKTGEGKTLVATLPAYLNALEGKGVHVVTVNDYLAKRDATWMGSVYRFLGMDVDHIEHEKNNAQRKAAYDCDITYATNNELGFDYLKDNMVFKLEERVQRGHPFAIVDEVDSILIDEARTPLIISGPQKDNSDECHRIDEIISAIVEENDFDSEIRERLIDGMGKKEKKKWLEDDEWELFDRTKLMSRDMKKKNVWLTDEAIERIEGELGIDNLYDPKNVQILRRVDKALQANAMMENDKDYVVMKQKKTLRHPQTGLPVEVEAPEVVIVDEFTGRLSFGRKFSEGLHQAIEAKEGCPVSGESDTLASTSFQNFFKMYDKVAGMTGTAETEAAEFVTTYKLETVVIPPNKECQRIDHPDTIYKKEKGKNDAVVKEVKEMQEIGRPVLVGTASVDKSQLLSDLLTKEGIEHYVLNAKHHEEEAKIVAEAGKEGKVVISTNMAGRGTDIKLGEGVEENGGLHIIGTCRHESRRIDNQLRGRAGRQGDKGSSRFILSLEDRLLDIFGGNKIQKRWDYVGVKDDEGVQSKVLSGLVERAQMQLEGIHQKMREGVLKYDDVMNTNRQLAYAEREALLKGVMEYEEDGVEYKKTVHDTIKEAITTKVDFLVEDYLNDAIQIDDWDTDGLVKSIDTHFNVGEVDLDDILVIDTEEDVEHRIMGQGPKEDIRDRMHQIVTDRYSDMEADLGDFLDFAERTVALHKLDEEWNMHLKEMDYIREGIHHRSHARKDPLVEYKNEAMRAYNDMFGRVENDTLKKLFRMDVEDIKSTLEKDGGRTLDTQTALRLNINEDEWEKTEGISFNPNLSQKDLKATKDAVYELRKDIEKSTNHAPN